MTLCQSPKDPVLTTLMYVTIHELDFILQNVLLVSVVQKNCRKLSEEALRGQCTHDGAIEL